MLVPEVYVHLGITYFHGFDGVCADPERIHRGKADPRLQANPNQWASFSPQSKLDRLFRIAPPYCLAAQCIDHCSALYPGHNQSGPDVTPLLPVLTEAVSKTTCNIGRVSARFWDLNLHLTTRADDGHQHLCITLEATLF